MHNLDTASLPKPMWKSVFLHQFGCLFQAAQRKVTINYFASFKQMLAVVIKHSEGHLAIYDFKSQVKV